MQRLRKSRRRQKPILQVISVYLSIKDCGYILKQIEEFRDCQAERVYFMFDCVLFFLFNKNKLISIIIVKKRIFMLNLRTEERQELQQLIFTLHAYESHCCYVSPLKEESSRLGERVIVEDGCGLSGLFVLEPSSLVCSDKNENRKARNIFRDIVSTINNKMKDLGVSEGLPVLPDISAEPLTVGNIQSIRTQFDNLLERVRGEHIEAARRGRSPRALQYSPDSLNLPGVFPSMS